MLELQPLSDPEFKEELKARGKKFASLKGRHYLHYAGDKIAPNSGGATPLSFKFGPAPPPVFPQPVPVPMPVNQGGMLPRIGNLVNFQVFQLHLGNSH